MSCARDPNDGDIAMAPSTNAVSTVTTVTGTIRSFDIQRGFGFLFGEDGGHYFFHVNDARVVDAENGFGQERETRRPRVGEKIVFAIVPRQNSGQAAKAAPWAFKDKPAVAAPAVTGNAPRKLPVLPTAPAAKPIAPVETLEARVARKAAGLIGLVIAFESLNHSGLSEAAIRAFCEVSLDGERLWDDFKRRCGDDEDYGWADYAKEVLRENIDELIGPKDCKQPVPLRGFLWQQSVAKATKDDEVFGLYLGEPAMIAKFNSVCKSCNITSCMLYKSRPASARRS